MHKNKTLIFLIFLLLPMLIFANEKNQQLSIKSYKNLDEQKVFNLVKKIYSYQKDDINFETSWDKLYITKRKTVGFINIQIEIENLLLSSFADKQENTTKFQVEFFTTLDDKTNPLLVKEEAIYELFWNRVEFAFGLTKRWIDCKDFNTVFSLYNPLCSIKKETLKE